MKEKNPIYPKNVKYKETPEKKTKAFAQQNV
jgi:hypothetical protein